MQPLLVITGPTAVGKTALTIGLAKRLDGEIVSADSMQVYRGMDIGTAKPTLQEREGVPHHLLDIADPTDRYDVARFCADASRAIAGIAARGRLPIVSGGTGLYICALLDGADFSDGARDDRYRDWLSAYDADALHALLETCDPASAAAIHKNNRPRVIRALEYYHVTGKPLSAHKAVETQSPYQAAVWVLDRPREELYARIDARVDDMLDRGLLDEVQRLLQNGVPPTANAMQGLGYKELVWYRKGACTYAEAVRLLKRNTRRYAKRQLTWWRRRADAQWLPADISIEQAIHYFKGGNMQ